MVLGQYYSCVAANSQRPVCLRHLRPPGDFITTILRHSGCFGFGRSQLPTSSVARSATSIAPPTTSGSWGIAFEISYQSSRRTQSRHRPRCRGIERCFRSSNAEQKLHRSELPGSAMVQPGLRQRKRVHAEPRPVEANARYPLMNEPRVLWRGLPALAATTGERNCPGFGPSFASDPSDQTGPACRFHSGGWSLHPSSGHAVQHHRRRTATTPQPR